MQRRNFLHRLGDVVEIIGARLRFAFRIVAGNYPLPTDQQELNMAAIDNLATAVSNVKTFVASLQGELANADLTPQIVAATEALNALVPAPIVAGPAPVEPVIDPATGLPA